MVKNPLADAGNIMRCGFDPRVGKMPWTRAWQSTPVFLPGESMDRGAWRATVHRVTQSQTPLKRLSTHAYTYPFFFLFFSIMGYPRILTVVPCATQYDLLVCCRAEINTTL